VADAPNTFSTLNGLFKINYADKLLDLVPDFAILQKKIDFAPAGKGELGNFYAQPVNLSQEGGFTYNGEAGTVVTLNDAINGVMKEAQVKGSELILRAQLSYTALSRAATQGARAFKRASSWKVLDMNNSMRKRLEIAMLYGQTGVATVSSLASQVITITDATWAGGIWAGTEGHVIDVYQSDLATLRQGGLVIASVDSDAKTITVTGTTTGIVATDVVFFKGANSAGTFNEMAGLKKIITNTGTLFNISAATYSLWKGNTVSSVGQLTHGKIQDAISKPVNKGLMEKVLCLVAPKAWGVLNSDQSALRAYDSSYSSKKSENGAESLVFHSTNGEIEIMSHPFVKEGDVFMLPLDTVCRVGSTDMTFAVPGFEGEQFFTLVSAKNAVEIQCMADQAIFIEKPAHSTYMSGVTYA
jgi:hypothetical protein